MNAGNEIKLTFIELAENLLDKDKIDDFLDFINFTKEHSLIKSSLFTSRSWKSYGRMIHYKKVKIGALCLYSIKRSKPDGSWCFFPDSKFFYEYNKCITDEKMKEFVINSMNYIKCRGCNGSQCMNGREDLTGEWKMPLFGKDFINVCSGMPLMIISPSGDDLELTKQLVLLTKDILQLNS